jgi:hypothetical protein
MTTSIYVLNLSGSATPARLQLDPGLFPLLGGSPSTIAAVGDVPDKDALILYIVDHAVPNGLAVGGGGILPEAVLAKAIRDQRKALPTLLIWDICFAKSFLVIPSIEPWGDNFVHVFSCAAHERTWHTGKAAAPPMQTLFSTELRKAMETLRLRGGSFEWAAVENELQSQLRPIQTPTVTPQTSLQPYQFQLCPQPSATSADSFVSTLGV